MTHFTQNNLAASTSLYLQSHAQQPIWWQEWSAEVLAYAQKNNKPLLVSSGYSSCHWCHVMAREAFSDDATAEYINKHFVAIKIDRELRPDIDAYLIDYAQKNHEQAGWPLNVILTPEQHPFFAATYLPAHDKGQLPSLLTTLPKVLAWYEEHKQDITCYHPYDKHLPSSEVSGDEMINYLTQIAGENGFGDQQQFPPHTSLQFLLHYLDHTSHPEGQILTRNILDNMATKGLHDHVGGGFFRYCTDANWQVPHFEKMLNDQALMLWNYAMGYKVFKDEGYKIVALRIIAALESQFLTASNLYGSSLDADAEGKEGATYLWKDEDIKKALSAAEYETFQNLYELVSVGTHIDAEGKHIVRKDSHRHETSQDEAEIIRKLAAVRAKKPQPARDNNVITFGNALVGIGLCLAGRYLQIPELIEKSSQLFDALITKHYKDGMLHHSSDEDVLSGPGFLDDYAGVLLWASYLYETEPKVKKAMQLMVKHLESFQAEGKWIYNPLHPDFTSFPALYADMPTPSSASLVELALLRTQRLLHLDLPIAPSTQYRHPYFNDYYNLVVWLHNLPVVHITSPNALDWSDLPLGTMQTKGNKLLLCKEQGCQEFSHLEGLLASLGL